MPLFCVLAQGYTGGFPTFTHIYLLAMASRSSSAIYLKSGKDNTQWKAHTENRYLVSEEDNTQGKTYSKNKSQRYTRKRHTRKRHTRKRARHTRRHTRKRARYTQQTTKTSVPSEQDTQQTTGTSELSEQDTRAMIGRQDRWGLEILHRAWQQTHTQNITTLIQLCELTELIRRRIMVQRRPEDTQHEEADDNTSEGR